MIMLPVRLPDGRKLKLSAGGQNVLIKKIIEEFCPRFTPGGLVVYVGDTGDKRRHWEVGYLEQLGLTMDEHGKIPDVVVHLPEKNWLVLIEAVTSHGPIGLKRHNELKELFKSANAGLVFVTAFLTRRAMTKYLGEIAWETEVWVSDAPSHIIHFNGERFLGPYN
jgi:adenine-specific DNA-methyltransferase